MSIITKLVQGKKDPSRVNVFLDHKFAFSLSADEVLQKHLKVGTSLDQTVQNNLQGLSDQEKIFAKIINFISYRPRSEKEIRDRLYKYLGKDHEEQKSAIVSKLERLGYINDLDFATWFVASRVKNRPRSRRHLASELFSKGIEKDIIDKVLDNQADDREAIRRLIAKKKNMDYDKLVSFLARRGFSWEIIKEELALSRAEGLDN